MSIDKIRDYEIIYKTNYYLLLCGSGFNRLFNSTYILPCHKKDRKGDHMDSKGRI